MTVKEKERLAILENEVKNVKDDVNEVKVDVKEIRNLLEEQQKTFVTYPVLGVILTVLLIVIGFLNYAK